MGKMFAGLIYVFLHIKINGIDLLPAFVGYYLIYKGMEEVSESGIFAGSRTLTLVSAIFSAVMWLKTLLGIYIDGLFGILLTVVGVSLQLLVTYRMAKGVQELEEQSGQLLGGAELAKAWLAFPILTVASYVVSCFSGELGAIFLLATFVAIVVYIVLFYRAWKAWERRLT